MERTRTQPSRTADARQPAFTDAEIADAKRRMARAFELSGLVSGSQPVCPNCGCTTKGKVKIRENGSWTCYKCGTGSADDSAIWFLADRLSVPKGELKGRRFLEIVGMLLDRPLPALRSAPALQPKALDPTIRIEAVEEFHAVVDVEVYEAILASGDAAGAKEYYGRWHISPDAVEESRAVMLLNVDGLQRELTERFGLERLAACGVVRLGDPDGETAREREPYWVVSNDYPVIEPHCRPDGRVVGMQFRPSYEREARFRKHLSYKAQKEAAEANGETYRDPKWDEKYIPKFMSLRGGVPGEHLVGCGLPRLAGIEPTDVCVVEGFKDYLAMRTMGFEAYAIPGSKAMPAKKVCRVLAKHTMVLTLDADAAGQAGVEALQEHFDELEVRWRPPNRGFPDGWDVTDYLVSKHAQRGCPCQTCDEFRRNRLGQA